MNEQSAEQITSRAVAAGIVRQWLENGDFPDRMMERIGRDRAFVTEMVYGVAKWRRALEWIVKGCADHSLDEKTLPYLFVGIYQAIMMDNVEEYAAVNETVEAAKKDLGRSATGFVNGVLRRVIRERDEIRKGLSKQSLGIRESHPDILVKKWTRQFGEETTAGLCRWNNERPHVVIRPNMLKTTPQTFRTMSVAAGIETTGHPWSPEEWLVLPRGVAVTAVPGYEDGLFSVQDPSTMIAVDVLDPQPGERILDACAAPGGKTVLIAERMRGKGRITALEAHAGRLARLRENTERMAVSNVSIVNGNAAKKADAEEATGKTLFDRILLDVPCTNTGVLRRRPDARWRFSNRRLAELVGLQRAILDGVSDLLKPGGLLVYSTCSLERQECEGMVGKWLKNNQRFTLVKEKKTFPPESQTDGVYAAGMCLAE
ncbi:MAG: 16S rRNA (cytosine(967)-C(5))-methyltransferase RsmB [Lentisphaerae bacterium]|nr:16S rRNA (cytosine(967)-C(5))-methyltransferase RsmB [Lentisphaerota bacterium]